MKKLIHSGKVLIRLRIASLTPYIISVGLPIAERSSTTLMNFYGCVNDSRNIFYLRLNQASDAFFFIG